MMGEGDGEEGATTAVLAPNPSAPAGRPGAMAAHKPVSRTTQLAAQAKMDSVLAVSVYLSEGKTEEVKATTDFASWTGKAMSHC